MTSILVVFRLTIILAATSMLVMHSEQRNRTRKADRIANTLIDAVLLGRVTAARIEFLADRAAQFTDREWALAAQAADPRWTDASSRTRHIVIRKLLHRAQDARLEFSRSTLRRVGAATASATTSHCLVNRGEL